MTSAPAASATERPAIDVDRSIKQTYLRDKARAVEARYGKSVSRQAWEAVRLALGPGKITMSEYYSMRLFDDAAFEGMDKTDVLGMAGIQRLIGGIQGTSSWIGPLNDKVAFGALLRGLGLPAPAVRGIYAEKGRGSAYATLADKAALTEFLSEPDNYPLFGKPVSGTLGIGAAGWLSVDRDRAGIIGLDGRSTPVEDLAATIAGNYAQSGYMFQERVSPHAAIRPVCGDRLATVRIVSVTLQTTTFLGAEWRVPAGENVVDNFKHKGNILAELDMETGEVLRAIRGTGIEQEEIIEHPDTGHALVGFRLPNWEAMLDTVRRAARIFGVPVLGWDVALTEEGCVLIEANTCPDLRGLQSVMRCGFHPALRDAAAQLAKLEKKHLDQRRQARRTARRKNVAMALTNHAPDI